jgi:hypothetical protein
LLAICFAPSLADSFIFLTLTRLVVVFVFVNFSFALFTPPPSRRLSSIHCIGRIGLDQNFFSCGLGKVPMIRFIDEPGVEDAHGGVYDATVDP